MKRTIDGKEESDVLPRKKPYSGHRNVGHHSNRFSSSPSNFHGPFPYFRKPMEIGSFSIDSQRQFIHDRRHFKKYAPPIQGGIVKFDLRAGYDTFQKRDESKKDFLDYILKWILLNKHKFRPHTSQAQPMKENSVSSLFTDFVCWRGLLTKFLCTPYENRDDCKIAATLFHNTIYMCEFDTDHKIEMLENQTDKQKEMTYWGYKFEQYVTKADSCDSKVETTAPVNNSEAFCSVVRSRLENHSLVYGGEVDCFEVKNEKQKYIELKTSREIETVNQERNFKRFKLIKWWAQSFLIGIEKIIGGFRGDDGVVRRLESYETISISKMCRDLQNPWEPSVCFNFLNKILNYIKEVVTEDDARVVYLFSMEPKCGIQYEKLPKNSEFCFLPEWYISEIRAIK